MRRRHVKALKHLSRAALLPVCGSALLLAGCGVLPVGPPATPSPTASSTPTRAASKTDLTHVGPVELKDRLVAAGRLAPVALRTSRWKLTRGPVARACEQTGSGLEFTWAASGPGSAHLVRDTHRIADAYRKAGFQIGVDRARSTSEQLFASRDATGTVQLDVRRAAVRVVATSECIAGTPSDYSSLPPEAPVPNSSH